MKFEIGDRVVLSSPLPNSRFKDGHGIIKHIYTSGNIEVEWFEMDFPLSQLTDVQTPDQVKLDKKYHRNKVLKILLR